jgi:hypothetical protein
MLKGYGTLSSPDRNEDKEIELDHQNSSESAPLLERDENVDYEASSPKKQKSKFSALKLPSMMRHKLFDDTSLSFKKGAIKEYEFFKDDTPVCEGIQ